MLGNLFLRVLVAGWKDEATEMRDCAERSNGNQEQSFMLLVSRENENWCD
jgi:hypothetical protein